MLITITVVITITTGGGGLGLFSLLYFVHFGDKLLGRIEHAVGLLPAREASLTLLVVSDGTLFTEVVFALRHDGIDKGLFADEALEGQVFVVRADDIFVVVLVFHAVGAVLHFPFKLPAELVVGSVVHELTAVAEATESRFLVVLANVGGVIPTHRRSGEKKKLNYLSSPSIVIIN